MLKRNNCIGWKPNCGTLRSSIGMGKTGKSFYRLVTNKKERANCANFTNVIHFRNLMHCRSHSRFRFIILNSTGQIGQLIQFTCSTFRWGFRRSRSTTTRSFTSVQSGSSSAENWSQWTSKYSTLTARCPSSRQAPNLLAWSTTEAALTSACLRRFRRGTAAPVRQVMQPFHTKIRPYPNIFYNFGKHSSFRLLVGS